MAMTILEVLKLNFVGHKVRITQPDQIIYIVDIIDIKAHTGGIFCNVFEFVTSDEIVYVDSTKATIEIIE